MAEEEKSKEKVSKDAPLTENLEGDDAQIARNTRANAEKLISGMKPPIRNEDGSIKWDNYFIQKMKLANPVTRADVFPNGTEGISDDEIVERVMKFLAPLGTRSRFGHAATPINPTEFPEVIDEDFRALAEAINVLEFARTAESCSGHPDRGTGYARSHMRITLDRNYSKSEEYIKRAQEICDEYVDRENINTQIKSSRVDENGLSYIKIDLNISDPENWQEKETDLLPPLEKLNKVVPGILDDEGELTEVYGNLDREARKGHKAYIAEYQKSRNAYSHSDRCKAIRDEFWSKIEEATKLIISESH